MRSNTTSRFERCAGNLLQPRPFEERPQHLPLLGAPCAVGDLAVGRLELRQSSRQLAKSLHAQPTIFQQTLLGEPSDGLQDLFAVDPEARCDGIHVDGTDCGSAEDRQARRVERVTEVVLRFHERASV